MKNAAYLGRRYLLLFMLGFALPAMLFGVTGCGGTEERNDEHEAHDKHHHEGDGHHHEGDSNHHEDEDHHHEGDGHDHNSTDRP